MKKNVKQTILIVLIILLAAIIVLYLVASQQRVALRPAFDAVVIERYEENNGLVAAERYTEPGELDSIWDILSGIKMDVQSRPLSGSVKYRISLFDGDTLRDMWYLDNESVVCCSQFLGNAVDSSGAFEKVDAFFSLNP